MNRLTPGPLPVYPENEPLPSRKDVHYWQNLGGHVLPLLVEPRDWAFLEDWVRQNRFGHARFRQVLAWLEDQGAATSFTRKEGRKAKVYWVRREWLKAHEQQMKS